MRPPAAPKGLRPQPSSSVAEGPRGQPRKGRRPRASSQPFLGGTLKHRCLGSKLLSGNEQVNPAAASWASSYQPASLSLFEPGRAAGSLLTKHRCTPPCKAAPTASPGPSKGEATESRWAGGAT